MGKTVLSFFSATGELTPRVLKWRECPPAPVTRSPVSPRPTPPEPPTVPASRTTCSLARILISRSCLKYIQVREIKINLPLKVTLRGFSGLRLFGRGGCNVDESGNLQKPLKITSFKQIYLQIEKKKNIYKTTLTLKRSNNWINLPNYNFTNMFNPR